MGDEFEFNPKQLALFISDVKSAMARMHKTNKYYYWHFVNADASSIVPVGSGAEGEKDIPKRSGSIIVSEARTGRNILTLDYSSVVIMWCVTGFILVFLCIVLVRHYRRRARIHGYVVRFVRNAKKSTRFVSEKHTLHN